MIKQKELEEYVELERKLKKAEQRLRIAKGKFQDMDSKLLIQVLKGIKVEKGEFIAEHGVIFKRANIRWKEHVVSLKGIEYVERVLAEAPRDEKDVLVVKRVGR